VLVRTSGRYPGARGGSGDGSRSWLLIKHRDEWAGEVDIAEFAPLSVKSGGDFEDILGEDTPAVWRSNRPAKGGEAGAMLAQIIERVARIKSERNAEKEPPRQAGPRRSTSTAQRPRTSRSVQHENTKT